MKTKPFLLFAYTSFILLFINGNLFSQINSSSFSQKIDILTGGSNVVYNDVADFDNDGKNDIVTNVSSNTIGVSRNTSMGTMSSSSFGAFFSYNVGSDVNSITTGDIDGDGKIDILSTNYTSVNISILRNTSTGVGNINFAPKFDTTCTSNPGHSALADLDGDGKLDIIIGNFGSNSFTVYKNNSTPGNIILSTRTDFVVSGGFASTPHSVAVGDLDGDLKKDVAFVFYNGYVGLFRNTSTLGIINFAPSQNYVGANLNAGIALSDLDADNKLDVIVSSYNTGQIFVYKNTSSVGSISVAPLFFLNAGTNPYGLAVQDVDADNKPEIIVANIGSNNVSVFKNIASPGVLNSSSFNLKTDFTTGTAPQKASVSDLNGDGKKEIITSNNGASSLSIFRNLILASQPSVAPTNLTFSNITSNSARLTFTKGNGSRRIVLARATNAVNAVPLDSFSYVSNGTFGLGAQIGTGNFVVYSDTGNTFVVNGLTPGSNYYFSIFEYNGIGGFSNYLTSSALTGNTSVGFAFYSKSSGDLNLLSSWGTNTDGSGSSPTNFSTSGTVYYIVNNGSPSISANWLVSGANTTVIFGDGITSGNFLIPSNTSFTADSIYVNNNYTFTIQGSIICSKSVFLTNSTAQYTSSSLQNIAAANYGNLIINGSTKTLSGNVTVRGVLAMFNNIDCNGFVLTLGESINQTGTLNRSSGNIIGSFKRWFSNNTNSGTTGLMPIGTASIYRPIQVNYTSAPTSGGTLTATFVSGSGGNAGFPLFDFTTSPIVQLNKTGFEGYWRITPADGLAGGAYTCAATATSFSGINSVSDLRLVRRNLLTTSWSIPGTSLLGSGTVAIPIVSATGITSLGGEFAIASDNSINPLPVKLISFKADYIESDVVLNWTTASEVNNSHFEVEKLIEKDWKVIGKVIGKGNSTALNNYKFIETGILKKDETESMRYRLKQVDFDGSFAYSEIVSIYFDSKDELISIAPIPMQDVLNVNFENNQKIEQITIYDYNGKVVLQVNNEANIDVSRLKNGFYTVNVITDRQTFTRKVVK